MVYRGTGGVTQTIHANNSFTAISNSIKCAKRFYRKTKTGENSHKRIYKCKDTTVTTTETIFNENLYSKVCNKTIQHQIKTVTVELDAIQVSMN